MSVFIVILGLMVLLLMKIIFFRFIPLFAILLGGAAAVFGIFILPVFLFAQRWPLLLAALAFLAAVYLVDRQKKARNLSPGVQEEFSPKG